MFALGEELEVSLQEKLQFALMEKFAQVQKQVALWERLDFIFCHLQIQTLPTGTGGPYFSVSYLYMMRQISLFW